MADRNPILLPEIKSTRPSCPKCAHETFSGRSVSGAITFTCHKCGNKWQGGLPRTMADASHPLVPDLVPPTVQFIPVKDKTGHILSIEELKNPPSKTPDFRGGALIKDDGEI